MQRVGQRDIMPVGIRRRNQNVFDLVYSAILSPSGGSGEFTELQKALDFVNKLGGGAILVRRGVYQISNVVRSYSNIYLIGEDSENTIFDFLTQSGYIYCAGLSNIRFENIQFKNGRSTSGVIYLTNSNTIDIANCVFTNNSAADGSGVDIYLDNTGGSVTKIIVTFCDSTNPGKFAYLKNNNSRTLFSNNSITTPISNAFYADTTGRGTFVNNVIIDAVKSVFYGKFSFSRFNLNRTTYTTTSLLEYQVDLLSGSSNINISDCHFSNGNGGGIRITSSGGMQIVGNNISGVGAGFDGVNIVSSDDIQLIGNFIEGNNKAVNITDAASDRNIVLGNRLSGGTTNNGTGSVIANNT